MSIRAIVWAFDQECPSPAAKLVLIKLADHANDEGECWPSQGRIAADCGLARQTVNAQVKKLVDLGLVAVEQRKNEQGQQSNRYFLRCHIPRHPLSIDVTPLSSLVTPPVISRDTEPSMNLKDIPNGISSRQREEAFEVWWRGYPRKVGKGDAQKAWAKAVSLVSIEELTAARDRYAAECAARGTEERYIKHPSGWLNGKHWLDEPSAKPGGAVNGSAYEEPWQQRLASWRKGQRWMRDLWGPPPGEIGSRVPPELT